MSEWLRSEERILCPYCGSKNVSVEENKSKQLLPPKNKYYAKKLVCKSSICGYECGFGRPAPQQLICDNCENHIEIYEEEIIEFCPSCGVEIPHKKVE